MSETHAEKRTRLRPVAEVLARYAWESRHEEAAMDAEAAGLTVDYEAFDDLGSYRDRLIDDQFHAARHLDNAGLIAKQAAPPVATDERPHSRACGWRAHDHGPGCHANCPTCGGAS